MAAWPNAASILRIPDLAAFFLSLQREPKKPYSIETVGTSHFLGHGGQMSKGHNLGLRVFMGEQG